MSNGSSAFSWEDYISLARNILAVTSPSEAAKRSAVSRSYYGAFILARNLAITKGWVIPVPSDNIHHTVIDYFTSQPTDPMKQIGHTLDRLRNHRNKADYDDVFEKLNEHSSASVKRAEHIKNMLNKLK